MVNQMTCYFNVFNSIFWFSKCFAKITFLHSEFTRNYLKNVNYLIKYMDILNAFMDTSNKIVVSTTRVYYSLHDIKL